MKNDIRKVRDPDLLEALDRLPREHIADSTFRVVRHGRDPIEPSRNAARWDLGQFSVLYTALDPNGAIAEIDFHLSRQPVFPSLYQPTLYELSVSLSRVGRLDNLELLEALGVSRGTYTSIAYGRTREIGDAAAFLGFDGLLVPNARWNCTNLVLIADEIPAGKIAVSDNHGVIDLREWRKGALFRRR